MENHRCHDYRHLVARWRAVARNCGLKLHAFAESGGYPVYHLATESPSDLGLYLSAGIHGDEPAGSEGLIAWAEKHLPRLVRRGVPLLILPCLNPWGLVHNRRSDADDHDLNRLFDRRNLSPIAELKRLVARRRFGLAVHLHEDYDARGTYLYELTAGREPWGAALLADCRRAIAVDPRRLIDGQVFEHGHLWRRRPRNVPGCPEALHLFPGHCARNLTFETPSEFDLRRRVRAQVLLLEGCTRRLLTPPP